MCSCKHGVLKRVLKGNLDELVGTPFTPASTRIDTGNLLGWASHKKLRALRQRKTSDPGQQFLDGLFVYS